MSAVNLNIYSIESNSLEISIFDIIKLIYKPMPEKNYFLIKTNEFIQAQQMTAEIAYINNYLQTLLSGGFLIWQINF